MAICRVAKVDLPDGDGKVGMVDLTASPFKPLLSEEDMAGDFALPFLTTYLTLSPRLSLSLCLLSLCLHLGSISRALSILPCVCRARSCPFSLVFDRLLLCLQSTKRRWRRHKKHLPLTPSSSEDNPPAAFPLHTHSLFLPPTSPFPFFLGELHCCFVSA